MTKFYKGRKIGTLHKNVLGDLGYLKTAPVATENCFLLSKRLFVGPSEPDPNFCGGVKPSTNKKLRF